MPHNLNLPLPLTVKGRQLTALIHDKEITVLSLVLIQMVWFKLCVCSFTASPFPVLPFLTYCHHISSYPHIWMYHSLSISPLIALPSICKFSGLRFSHLFSKPPSTLRFVSIAPIYFPPPPPLPPPPPSLSPVPLLFLPSLLCHPAPIPRQLPTQSIVLTLYHMSHLDIIMSGRAFIWSCPLHCRACYDTGGGAG